MLTSFDTQKTGLSFLLCLSNTLNPSRWGIVCAGKLSSDFTNALSVLDKTEHSVTAIGARNAGRAKDFAAKFGIENTFGDYDSMAKSDCFGVAYIASVTSNHVEVAKMFLSAGKHVLIEKPMALTVEGVKELVALAREKKVR